MAWRQIHDDVPVSRTLNAVSDFAERLYWRLLSQTDQWGRLPGDTCKIRAKCLPMLERADAEIDCALDELVAADRIALYHVDGVRYCELIDFDQRQTAGKMKRKPSLYPEKPLHDRRSTRQNQNQTQTERIRPEQNQGERDPEAAPSIAALVDRSLTSRTPSVDRLLALLPPHEVKRNTRGVLERKFSELPPHFVEKAADELLAANGVRSRVKYLNGIADRMLIEVGRGQQLAGIEGSR